MIAACGGIGIRSGFRGQRPLGIESSNLSMPKEVYRSPWFYLEGYLACTVKYSDGTKRTILQHRETMERHLGRSLHPLEHVHHKNENRTDNRLSNLEMSAGDHARLHRDDPEMVEFVCPECGLPAQKLARNVRHNKKMGKTGPFCGRSCAGSWSQRQQLGRG